ncbi:hypothetical protein [uncultured Amphritea sp.]|uniref:type IVB secretion system protein IcmW n=1 Tax=uncultured Amphritea sp. TaxID=981605 RepID=UPI0026017A65|nr:hypothetical protein [uncultured Amphritea sp.]
MDSTIDSFWKQDPELCEVIQAVESYEDWTETNVDNLKDMDSAVLRAIEVIESHSFAAEGAMKDNGIVESMLVLLGFMPASKALYYLSSLQQYQAFFEALSMKLNENPPLKAYAKTILGRAALLHQRALHLSVHSEANFYSLSLALEKILQPGY